jgi:hypothetical protein
MGAALQLRGAAGLHHAPAIHDEDAIAEGADQIEVMADEDKPHAALRDEIVARVERLNMPSYTGFVQPKLTAVRDDQGGIVDVEISYPLDFTRQMLEYSGQL